MHFYNFTYSDAELVKCLMYSYNAGLQNGMLEGAVVSMIMRCNRILLLWMRVLHTYFTGLLSMLLVHFTPGPRINGREALRI